MAIKYKPSFEYQGNEAANLARGIGFLADQVKALSMPQMRVLVCSYFDASYAELSRLLSYRDLSEIELGEHQAHALIALANHIAQSLKMTDIRKLRTWMGALIQDIEHCGTLQSTGTDTHCAEQKPLANAS